MFNFSKKVSPAEIFTELKNKGWFELTPVEALSEAEVNLKNVLSQGYLDTGVPYEETPVLQQRLNLGERVYWIVSLDLRVFADDPETLIEENGIVRLLTRINAAMRINSLQLFSECSDAIGYDEAFGLTVSVDGTPYEIYSSNNRKDFTWSFGVNGVVTILDSLLEKIGNDNRVYFSWDGHNDVRFYLLTDELFTYVNETKLDGGLGPIIKKI